MSLALEAAPSRVSGLFKAKYTLPTPGEALRRGHCGGAVKMLQAAINRAGAKPQLQVDGELGPLTEAALKRLTGRSSINASAMGTLRARVTGAHVALEMPAPVPAEALAPPEAGSVAGRTVKLAASQVGTPSRAPAQKASCGVFCAQVLQQAGVDVQWDAHKGHLVGQVDHVNQPWMSTPVTYRKERAAFENAIRPGDVIAMKGYPSHCCVVTRVHQDGSVETVDGAHPAIVRGNQKLSEVVSYARPIVAVELSLF